MPGPDRERHDELEQELRSLGPRIEYPATPDLTRAVRLRLDEADAERRPRGTASWRPSVRLAARWAAAIVVVVLAAVPIFSPAARDTLSGLFVAGGSASSGGSAGGAASSGTYAGETTGGTTRSPGENLGLGERLTLREARNRVGAGKTLLLPRSEKLGKPAGFCAYTSVVGGSRKNGVVTVYPPGRKLPSLGNAEVGLILTEIPGGKLSAFLPEGDADRSQKVNVGGRRGYWFPDGRRLDDQAGETGRLPGGALIWEKEGRTLLMRVNLPREEALRIAESVR